MRPAGVDVFPDPPRVQAPKAYLERVEAMPALFLMNVMLASGEYPWTVIRTEEQDEYMSALEAASVDQEIAPFAAFVARAVSRAVGEFE